MKEFFEFLISHIGTWFAWSFVFFIIWALVTNDPESSSREKIFWSIVFGIAGLPLTILLLIALACVKIFVKK